MDELKEVQGMSDEAKRLLELKKFNGEDIFKLLTIACCYSIKGKNRDVYEDYIFQSLKAQARTIKIASKIQKGYYELGRLMEDCLIDNWTEANEVLNSFRRRIKYFITKFQGSVKDEKLILDFDCVEGCGIAVVLTDNSDVIQIYKLLQEATQVKRYNQLIQTFYEVCGFEEFNMTKVDEDIDDYIEIYQGWLDVLRDRYIEDCHFEELELIDDVFNILKEEFYKPSQEEYDDMVTGMVESTELKNKTFFNNFLKPRKCPKTLSDSIKKYQNNWRRLDEEWKNYQIRLIQELKNQNQ